MSNILNKAIVFGDSIFKGVIFDKEKNRYQVIKKPCVDAILESKDFTVDNFSKFGLTTDKAIDYIKYHLSIQNDYKYAIIELGGNDCDYHWKEIALQPNFTHYPNVKLEDYENNLKTIIEEIRSYNIIPIIVSLPPISSKKYFDWFSQSLDKEKILEWLKDENYIYKHQELYNLCLANLAHRMNVHFIDLRLSLLLLRDFENYLCVDGIHLNEAGHKFIEQSFKKGEILV